VNLNDIAKSYSDETNARKFLETQRWPDGAICPHCGEEGNATELAPIKFKDRKGRERVRDGVWKCKGCRKQFTVRVGTIFEDSHIPLTTWLKAIHLLCASKKGMSSHQLHRMLGVTYKSAWFMSHRIRYAMAQLTFAPMQGIVEVDETYVGGKQRFGPHGKPFRAKSKKAPVVALVERGGQVRSFHHQQKVTGRTLKQVIRENVGPEAHIHDRRLRRLSWIAKRIPKAQHDSPQVGHLRP
jgi:transposase-like protein